MSITPSSRHSSTHGDIYRSFRKQKLREKKWLAQRVPKYIGSSDGELIQIVKDRDWMSFAVDLLGAASQTCSLIGSAPGEYGPYLAIFASPFYFPHAVKEARERFQLMQAAFRTARGADAFFWGGKGVGAVGSALNGIIKPLAGGMALAGVAHLIGLGLTFKFIFPIILIVLATIGGGMEGWNSKRIADNLKKYNELRGLHVNGSLQSLYDMLHYLQGPQLSITENQQALLDNHALEQKRFRDDHFTSDARRQEIQNRINKLIGLNERLNRKVQKIRAIIFENKRLKISNFGLGAEFDPESPPILKIDQLINIIDTNFQDGEDLLKKTRDKLVQLKKNIYKKGVEVVDIVHSEIHRKLSEQGVLLVAVLITFIAEILFLTYPNQTLGNALTLTTTLLGVAGLIYNKKISKKEFLSIEQHLGLLPTPLNFDEMTG